VVAGVARTDGKLLWWKGKAMDTGAAEELHWHGICWGRGASRLRPDVVGKAELGLPTPQTSNMATTTTAATETAHS
jgi:hypothetical protein